MSGLFQPISLYSNTPSGYPANLQWAGVFIPEIDKVITMTKWCNDHLNSSSLIIVPDGAYGWVKYYLNENLHVVKWGIYYHPFGSTVLLQNKSLIYIPEEMPNLLLAEPILQTFHPIYVLYTPSWDIQNAYDNIYPVAEKVISQGDAVLYRLKQ
ncbi:hypothetical protein MUP77_23090 [Candidatus Bathyarchaeota archaeon]|nr:hypothetical protein [Candidatus Bathyarchaeota archaeon]